jgi:hypothetical protein
MHINIPRLGGRVRAITTPPPTITVVGANHRFELTTGVGAGGNRQGGRDTG